MKVLLGIDDPTTLERVTAFARQQGWLENADVRAMCVISPMVFYDGFSPGLSPLAVQEACDFAAELLQETTAKLELEIGKKPKVATPLGDPARVLVDEARDWKADLVVVAARRVSKLERVLSGSVSSYVAEHAGCPVLVLKQILQLEPGDGGIHKDMIFCSQCSQTFLSEHNADIRCPNCDNAEPSTLRPIYREDDQVSSQMLTPTDFTAGD